MRKILGLGITLMTLLISMDLMAGLSVPVPVSIDHDARNASGSLAGARFSANKVESIGCGAVIIDEGSSTFRDGFCQAVDANGEVAVCFTDSPDLIEAIKGISEYGYLAFSWNEDDECIRVRSSTQSHYIPELKVKK